MAILLARHGETDGNALGVVQLPQVPLNERGQAQARALARRVVEHERRPVGAVVSSDYARARMTAEPVASAAGLELRLSPLLRERNFGDLRGRPRAQAGDMYGPDFVPPNGESWEVFHARVAEAWREMVELARRLDGERGRDLLVVTHGLVLYSLALHHLELPSEVAPGREAHAQVVIVQTLRHPRRVRLLHQDPGHGALLLPLHRGRPSQSRHAPHRHPAAA